LFGDMVEGSPQWWWKYVLPGLISDRLLSERIAERMGPFPDPWRGMVGERTGPLPDPWRSSVGELMGPFPQPWRSSVVGAIISAVSVKEVAQRMQEGELGSQLAERFDRVISEIIDDYCTPPWRWPWPWPGPPPWVLGAVEELALVANSLQEGSMREELLGVAGRMMERAASETGLG
jgi:hypothetical protein